MTLTSTAAGPQIQPDPVVFNGRVAVVTGAGRGLGAAYAMELGLRGALVVVNDVAVDAGGRSAAEDIAERIRASGGSAVSCADSVATPEGGEAVIRRALDSFGAVDIVINNAGFIRSAMFEDMTPAMLSEVMAVHLLGAFNVTCPAWPVMKARGYGRVVLTSSGSTFGMQANSNYVAAKSGLFGLARALALEGAAFGINVNTIVPYAVSAISVDNPLVGPDSSEFRALLNSISDRRPPEAVAAMALYLASSQCSVSGEAFSVLGGRYARVFSAVSDGWLAGGMSPTVEDVAKRIDQIRDTRHFTIPDSMTAEIAAVVERLGRPTSTAKRRT